MIGFILKNNHTCGWDTMLFDRHEDGECSITVVQDTKGDQIQFDYSLDEDETRELIQFLEMGLRKCKV